MVAGIKGVIALDADLFACTSSTKGELVLVSRSRRKVVNKVDLKDGEKRVRAESLCLIPGTKRLLVADGNGTLCSVDYESKDVKCVATTTTFATPLRLTSAAALDENVCFVAGAEKGNKVKCGVHRCDLAKGEIAEEPIIRSTIVRALVAEPAQGRFLVGAVDGAVDDDGVGACSTNIIALSKEDGFSTPKTLATVDYFVHAIAPHPRCAGAYALLVRHSGKSTSPPVRVVRFTGDGHAELLSLAAVRDTFHLSKSGGIAQFSFAGFQANIFGMRAGREHAMCLAPDGSLVTGCVHKTSKGILQVWNLQVKDGGAKADAPPGAPTRAEEAAPAPKSPPKPPSSSCWRAD